MAEEQMRSPWNPDVIKFSTFEWKTDLTYPVQTPRTKC